MRHIPLILLALVILIPLGASAQSIQFTGIGIHGILYRDGLLYTGPCHARARLWDAETGGTELASVVVGFVNVVDGAYSTSADFGTAYLDGRPLWIEMAFQCFGEADYTTEYRRLLDPVGYALFANSAASVPGAALVASQNIFTANQTIQGTDLDSTQLFLKRYSDDVLPASISLIKSRGTITAPAKINQNDYLGWFTFRGYDGSAETDSAYIFSQALQNWSSTAHGSRIQFWVTSQSASASPFNLLSLTGDGYGQLMGDWYTTKSIHLGGASAPSSATASLDLKSGTPPSSSPADQVSLYSADLAGTAGAAALTVRSENGAINQLGSKLGVNMPATTATLTSTLTVYGDGYFSGAVSADSLVDRTPAFDGDALSLLSGIRSSDGILDHKSLPTFAQATITSPDRYVTDPSCTPTVNEDGSLAADCDLIFVPGTTEQGRNINAMVTLLTRATQQLDARFVLSPPKYSKDPCIPGQYATDTTYFYVCVLTDTWRRIAYAPDDW